MFRRHSPITGYAIPSRLNACICIAQVIGIFACFWAARTLDEWWQLMLLASAFAILMNSVYSTIHEAEHAMLFANRRMNEIGGAVLALFFPAPFHLIRQGHIGHHLRNRSDDEAFDLYFDDDNVLWKWIAWIGILTGFYYLLVVLSNIVAAIAPMVLDRRRFRLDQALNVDRASAAFLEAFNPVYLKWIRLESIAAIVLHVIVVWGMRIPIGHYVLLYAAFGFSWSAMQYVHHFATERHVTRGTRNLWLLEPIDLMLLNHNWHRTHHEHPTIPWIYLPRLARDEGEGEVERGFLPLYYLRMWRGPRKTTEHVENKYAGRIIQ